MFNRIILSVLTCFMLFNCNQKGKYYPADTKDSSKVSSTKTKSTALITQPVETDNDLQLYCNNEITAYCVLLPLNEFKEVYGNDSVVKAQHKFVLRYDPESFTSIELQAFTIDRKNYNNTQLFYKRDKNDITEGGLGIDTAFIDEATHFYLIKGYLPNYMNMKFVQLNWILEDRIAVYINYDEKDEAIWKRRIATIIKKGVVFSNQ